MSSRVRAHIRSNVVGYVALFIALTGTAYAAGPLKPGDPAGGDLTGTYPNPLIAGNAVGSNEVINNSLTGDDVNESTLAGVPSTPSGPAGGDLTGSYPNPSLAAPEPWREVGTPGQPPFIIGCGDGDDPCWVNDTAFAGNSAAFMRDPLGVVHLKGAVVFDPGGSTGLGGFVEIFSLPEGYRPAATEHQLVIRVDPISFYEAATLRVHTDGSVGADVGHESDEVIFLDGITFRCSPSGSNGCP